MADLLAVEDLSAGYGRGRRAVATSAFRLGEGEALAVLGRNGVGKTTLIDTHRRRDAPLRADRSTLGGREIGALAPETRAALGIGWVPQERNIFRSLTRAGEHHGGGPARPVDARARLRALPAPQGAPHRSPAARCPAASSRCWRSAGRSRSIRACCCSTSRPRVWRRSSSRSCCAPLRKLLRRGGHGGHRRRAAGAQDPADHRSRDRFSSVAVSCIRATVPHCSPIRRRSSASSESPAGNDLRKFSKLSKIRLQRRGVIPT